MTTNDTRTQLEEERRLAAKVLSHYTSYDPIGTQKLAEALPLRNAQVEAVLALHRPSEYGCTNECREADGGLEYPCPTVRAIEEAGE